jgi:hypothetical protein
VSGQFQEKQAELQSAVVKVDQLNQQLEDLRRGRLNGLQPLGGPLTGTAALELRKLYQELQVHFLKKMCACFGCSKTMFWVLLHNVHCIIYTVCSDRLYMSSERKLDVTFIFT